MCGFKVSERKERALEMTGGWCESAAVKFLLIISFVCFGAVSRTGWRPVVAETLDIPTGL